MRLTRGLLVAFLCLCFAAGTAMTLTRVKRLQSEYPGLQLEAQGHNWHIHIPDIHRTDHEAHFGQVMEHFLSFLRTGKIPAWETPNTIAK